MSTSRIHALDLRIAERLHQLRIQKGLTQKELAEILGVSYQQAHKYEKGINRISAGRLALIAEVMQVPIHYFFEGLVAEQHYYTPELEGLVNRGVMETARHFRHISNDKTRQALAALIRAISAEDVQERTEPDERTLPSKVPNILR